jgi:hypothetical protein
MTDMLRVLAVGSKASWDLVRDALLFHRRSHLLVASDYWEIFSLWVGEAEQVSVAVIDLCTSDRELRRRTAEHIRRRWPGAQILLVGPEAEVPEDPLYDERIPPGLEAAELLAAMERLVNGKQRSMRARKHDPDVSSRVDSIPVNAWSSKARKTYGRQQKVQTKPFKSNVE